MQIRHCEACGIRLTELETNSRAQVSLCHRCSANRAQTPAMRPQVLAQSTPRRTPVGGLPIAPAITASEASRSAAQVPTAPSRKSSSIRLPAIKAPASADPDDSLRQTPARGLPATSAVNASEPDASLVTDSTSQAETAIGPAVSASDAPTEELKNAARATPPDASIFPEGDIFLEEPEAAASPTPSPDAPVVPAGEVASVPPYEPPPPSPPTAAKFLAAEPAPARVMAFYYCEKCGKRVTDADLAAGRAQNKQLRGYYCGVCAEGAMTLSFDAITHEELLKDALEQEKLQLDAQKSAQTDRRPSNPRMPAAKARSIAPPNAKQNTVPPGHSSSTRLPAASALSGGPSTAKQNTSPPGHSSSTRLPAANALSGGPSTAKQNTVPPGHSSSTRLQAAKETAGAPPTTEQIPVLSDRRSSSTRLSASKAVVGGPRRRSRLPATISSASGLTIGAVATVIALVAVVVFMNMRSGATGDAKPGPAPVASKPDVPIATPVSPAQAPATVTPRPVVEKPAAGTPVVVATAPVTVTQPAVAVPPAEPPVVAVEPAPVPVTPAATQTAEGSVSELVSGIERAAQLSKDSRYGTAQQLLGELKTRHSAMDWWGKHEKEWAALSQEIQQQVKEFQDDARETRDRLQQKPNLELVNEAVANWSSHARSGDAVTAGLAKEVLQDAIRARARLTEEGRVRRQQEIETKLTAYETAMSARTGTRPVDEVLEFVKVLEREIVEYPPWEDRFLSRMLGLRFDARRSREGEYMLYQTSVKTQGAGVELSYDFSTDPLKVWRFEELDRVETKSHAKWEREKKAILLSACGNGCKGAASHTSTAYLSLPFDFQAQTWTMEADVAVRELGLSTDPGDFGILVAEGSGVSMFFGFSEYTDKKGEKGWNFKLDGRLSARSAPSHRFLERIPVPAERGAKLQMNCSDGTLAFSATVDGKPVPIDYRTKLSIKPNFVGCYVRTHGNTPCSASFGNVRILGLPSAEALAARLKLKRENEISVPREEWRKQAQAIHGVVAKPYKAPDETVDAILKKNQ